LMSPEISRRHPEDILYVQAIIQPVNCIFWWSSPRYFPESPRNFGISPRIFFQKCRHNLLTKFSKTFGKLFIKKFYKKNL
jgi:hypothetical protein